MNLLIQIIANVFERNHIFLFTCLHSNLATLRTTIKTLTDRNLCSKKIAYLGKYLSKVKNHNDIFGCLSLVSIFYVLCFFILASKSELVSTKI